MIALVDTGVFAAAFSRLPRVDLRPYVARIAGRQVFLAVQTVAELRYGALVGGWGRARTTHLEAAIDDAVIVPVNDQLPTTVAELRLECRKAGHPLAAAVHANDLWIAATAVDLDVPLVSADRIFEDVPGLALNA